MNNTLLLQQFDLLATAPGGVARLRELILTLAVQGKLVPQDPSDEPASALLKRIRAEKERLIAEGKIKRDKPLAPIGEDEQPFGLPSGWAWVRNEALLSLRKGKNPKSLSDQPIGKPYLDIEALDRHQIRRYSDESQVVLCSLNDILVVCDGSRSGLVLQGKDGIVGSTLAVIETPQFIQSYVTLIFRAGFQRFNSGMKGAAIPHLDTKAVLAEVSGLPPLPEQARIVARVEELMRVCDALEATGQRQAAHHRQLVQTLLGDLTADSRSSWQRVAAHFDTLLDRPSAVDALEQTILQLAVRGQLVPQDPTEEPASALLQRIRAEKDRLIAAGKIKRDKPLAPVEEEEQPFELPSGWEWVRLRDLVTHLGDGLHGTPIYSTNGDYFFINGNNLSAGAITIKSETKRVDRAEFEKYRKPLDATSVLLSINGTLGRVAFYQDEKIILGKSACYFNVTAGFQKLFAKLLLECPDFMTYAEISATGTTIKNLGLKAIGDWPIALPPLPEQARIVARVAQLHRLCADLRQRLTQSQITQAALAEALVAAVAG